MHGFFHFAHRVAFAAEARVAIREVGQGFIFAQGASPWRVDVLSRAREDRLGFMFVAPEMCDRPVPAAIRPKPAVEAGREFGRGRLDDSTRPFIVARVKSRCESSGPD